MAGRESHDKLPSLDPNARVEIASLQTDLEGFKVEVRGDIGEVKDSIKKLMTAITSLSERVSDRGRVSAQTILGIISLVILVTGFFGSVSYGFIMLMSRAATHELELKTEHLKDMSDQADQFQSERTATVWNSLKGDIEAHKASPGHSGSTERIVSIEKALEEVETQIRGIGQTNNLKDQHQNALLSLLWQKVYGTEIPETHYWADHGRIDFSR